MLSARSDPRRRPPRPADLVPTLRVPRSSLWVPTPGSVPAAGPLFQLGPSSAASVVEQEDQFSVRDHRSSVRAGQQPTVSVAPKTAAKTRSKTDRARREARLEASEALKSVDFYRRQRQIEGEIDDIMRRSLEAPTTSHRPGRGGGNTVGARWEAGVGAPASQIAREDRELWENVDGDGTRNDEFRRWFASTNLATISRQNRADPGSSRADQERGGPARASRSRDATMIGAGLPIAAPGLFTGRRGHTRTLHAGRSEGKEGPGMSSYGSSPGGLPRPTYLFSPDERAHDERPGDEQDRTRDTIDLHLSPGVLPVPSTEVRSSPGSSPAVDAVLRRELTTRNVVGSSFPEGRSFPLPKGSSGASSARATTVRVPVPAAVFLRTPEIGLPKFGKIGEAIPEINSSPSPILPLPVAESEEPSSAVFPLGFFPLGLPPRGSSSGGPLSRRTSTLHTSGATTSLSEDVVPANSSAGLPTSAAHCAAECAAEVGNPADFGSSPYSELFGHLIAPTPPSVAETYGSSSDGGGASASPPSVEETVGSGDGKAWRFAGPGVTIVGGGGDHSGGVSSRGGPPVSAAVEQSRGGKNGEIASSSAGGEKRGSATSAGFLFSFFSEGAHGRPGVSHPTAPSNPTSKVGGFSV